MSADENALRVEQISSRVDPERFERDPDGSIVVSVHQVVRDEMDVLDAEA